MNLREPERLSRERADADRRQRRRIGANGVMLALSMQLLSLSPLHANIAALPRRGRTKPAGVDGAMVSLVIALVSGCVERSGQTQPDTTPAATAVTASGADVGADVASVAEVARFSEASGGTDDSAIVERAFEPPIDRIALAPAPPASTANTGAVDAGSLPPPSDDPYCHYDPALCSACVADECALVLERCEAAGDPGCKGMCWLGTEPACYFTDCRNWSCPAVCVEARQYGYFCDGPLNQTWRPDSDAG